MAEHVSIIFTLAKFCIKNTFLDQLKAQVSFFDIHHLYVCKFFTFSSSPEPLSDPIITRLEAKHPWVKMLQVC